jgi:hypothetical protein
MQSVRRMYGQALGESSAGSENFDTQLDRLVVQTLCKIASDSAQQVPESPKGIAVNFRKRVLQSHETCAPGPHPQSHETYAPAPRPASIMLMDRASIGPLSAFSWLS